jgi:hypothetical protein
MLVYMVNAHKEFWRIRRMHVKNFGVNGAYAEIFCALVEKARKESLRTVKRPKFGNGPLVRHPLSKLLKNHISARTGVSDLVQRGDWLYISFWTNKKRNNWG